MRKYYFWDGNLYNFAFEIVNGKTNTKDVYYGRGKPNTADTE